MTSAVLTHDRKDDLRRRIRIVIAVFAVREGVQAWKGDACCAAPVGVLTGERDVEGCEDGRCAAEVR